MSTMSASAAPLSPVTVRELLPEEFDKLVKVPPFDTLGFPDPRTARVIVGYNAEEEVVAYWFAFAGIHVEPLWMRDDYRGKMPGLLRRMWTGVYEMLKQAGHKVAFAIIDDKDLPGHGAMAHRLGFVKMPGVLYYVKVDSMEEHAAKGGDGAAQGGPPTRESAS